MNKVINFHHVRDIYWFEEIILILKNKYTLINNETLNEVYYGNKKINNACHITIDDGDSSFYKIIFPVLKKYKLPASIFVSPKICINNSNFWFQELRGYNEKDLKRIIAEKFRLKFNLINKYSLFSVLMSLRLDQIWDVIKVYQKNNKINNKQPQNMTITDLLEVEKSGLITIGAHTMNHPILANETVETCRKEICDSMDGLKDILGHQIFNFAYPKGIPSIDFGNREMEILSDYGCTIAFTTEAKNFTRADNPLSIPRFGFSFGSKYFIKVKLFAGSYWGKFRNLKSKGESQQRKELLEILN